MADRARLVFGARNLGGAILDHAQGAVALARARAELVATPAGDRWVP